LDTNIHLGRITAHNAVHLSLSRFVAKSPREQQLATQALHQRRLRIDPVHSRVKRCRSVKDWSRLWKQGVSDLTMALGCALHTFRVRLPPMAANTLSGINSPKSAERPRHSCRGGCSHPEPTNGTGSVKRWQPRTPAMAAGLADHVWTLREVLLFRVPPWPQPAGVEANSGGGKQPEEGA
jgi:hypothetical protein